MQMSSSWEAASWAVQLRWLRVALGQRSPDASGCDPVPSRRGHNGRASPGRAPAHRNAHGLPARIGRWPPPHRPRFEQWRRGRHRSLHPRCDDELADGSDRCPTPGWPGPWVPDRAFQSQPGHRARLTHSGRSINTASINAVWGFDRTLRAHPAPARFSARRRRWPQLALAFARPFPCSRPSALT